MTSNGAYAGDVAIVGMAGVFPKAADVRTFWENILHGVDAIDDPGPDWDADLVHEPGTEANDRIYTRRGGWVGGLLRFDPTRFGVMPRAVDGAEPEQFVALQVAHEALADAGYVDRPFDGERGEVILGRGTYVNRGVVTVFQHAVVVDQTLRLLASLQPQLSEQDLVRLKRELKAQLPPFNAETAPGLAHSVMCGRIANRLDLMGSAFTVDAACASSLIAIELGMQDLLSGKCDVVLAGGIQISTTFPVMLLFCQLGALSRKGQIRPFDPDTDGTLLGEGVGMVVLKRREDAERDGDRIYAVLKAVGTASDGRAMGVLAPRVEGEALAMRRAYERAGIAPATIGLIETHGTGTPVGDATEIEAMIRVFAARDGGPARCAIGSVKSMIGHSIPAAGVAGIIKAALALYHKVLPPTLHAEARHPKLAGTAFYLNGETRPWIHGGAAPRRAAVSAFGFGGINAHAVLEEHDPGGPARTIHRRWDSEVFVLAAGSRDELRQGAEALRRLVARRPAVDLAELAWAVNVRRTGAAALHLAIVARDVEDLDRKLAHAAGRLADPACHRIRERSGVYFTEAPLARQGSVAYVFPGEGSQYRGMLGDLCLHFPEVRAWFDLMDRAFHGHSRGFAPSDVVFPPPDEVGRSEGRLWEMESAIEAVFAANQGLHALLGRLGLRPAAMVGHSTGEYSALLAAGAVDIEDDAGLLRLVLDGNRVTEESLRDGCVPRAVLLAVGPAEPALIRGVVERAGGSLHLAMDNCLHQVVLAGSDEAVARARAELSAQGAVCQPLPFDRAYHTPLFAPVASALARCYAGVKLTAPRVTLYSCATAAAFPSEAEAMRRLALEQWVRPVRFRETVEAMYEGGARIFVEAGPRGNLTGFVEDILRGRPHLAVAANLSRRPGILQLNHLVAQLASHGLPLDLDPLYERRCDGTLRGMGIDEAAASPPPVDRSIRLPLGLPRLQLEPRPVASDRQNATAAPVPSTGTTAAPALPRLDSERVAPAGVVWPPAALVPAPPATAPVPEPTAERSTTAASRRPAASAAAAMGDHLTTMRRFLETEESVVKAFLGSGRRGEGAGVRGTSRLAAGGPSAPAPESARPSMPAGMAPAARPTVPFVGPITRHVPNREIEAVRTLDPREDLLLRDHTLGPRISEEDPSLVPLPVFPLAMSVEMMAEIASMLVPGLPVSGLRAVRVLRWLPVAAPVTLHLAASRSGTGPEVEVEISEVLGSGAREPVVRGVVCLGPSSPGPRRAQPLREGRPASWSAIQLYEEGQRHGMFHGPVFRGVASMERVGEDGAEATLCTGPQRNLFRSPTAPFVLDPLLLDAAGQVLGFWTADSLREAFVVFPVGFDRAEIGPATGAAAAACRLTVTALDATRVRADIEVADPAGRVLLRLTGWETKRLPMPERFYAFRLAPARLALGEPWLAALAVLPAGVDAAISRLELPPALRAVLEVDGRLWRDVLAHLVLSAQERATWRTMAAAEARRTEWLLGRVAAKDAVRGLLNRRSGPPVYPADVDIGIDGGGRPGASGGWVERLGTEPRVSLAHADGVAVAAAIDGASATGVGIDVERLRALDDGFEALAFADEEGATLAAVPSRTRAEWILRLWCAKEAAAKATGRGLGGAPRQWVVRQVDWEAGHVHVQAPVPAVAGKLVTDDRTISAYTGRDGDLVFAIALLRGGESPA